ncbi:MAG: 3-deoxy-7-phosphoheptulonate synthase [Chloroflexi bacterium]|nr:3-deoxy-7-phosphoheptulonate synthase [Chloroflexota bacterium]
MIIMEKQATKQQIDFVIAEVKKMGIKADVIHGAFRTVIGLVGDESKVPFDRLAILPGVMETKMVERPYKLISREYNKPFEAEGKVRGINVGNVKIGGGSPVYIAGPCAVESKKQIFRIAKEVKEAGAHILRGGIFKPRSSVHSFQGLGSSGDEEARQALSWLKEAGDMYGMPVMTEVRGEKQVDMIAEYVDILQVGSRNMYDQDLLGAIALKNKPVLYKRHFGASIEEFLSFAEYIAAAGNKDILLCERGIVPVGKGKNFTRYNLDIAAVPVIHKETFLPVIVDPSHAAGRRELIKSMSLAAIAAGAEGLMIEVHYNPKEALVDASQMITPVELKNIIEIGDKISKLV